SWPASISARASDSRVHSRRRGLAENAVSATRASRSGVRCFGSAAFMYWTLLSKYAARLLPSRFVTAVPFWLISLPLPVEPEDARGALPRVFLDQLRRHVQLLDECPVIHGPAGLRLPGHREPGPHDLRRLRHPLFDRVFGGRDTHLGVCERRPGLGELAGEGVQL